MFVFLHEMLLKVPTPLIWSLKPYGEMKVSTCEMKVPLPQSISYLQIVNITLNIHMHLRQD